MSDKKFKMGEKVIYWPDGFSPRIVRVIDIIDTMQDFGYITYKLCLVANGEAVNILSDDSVLQKYPAEQVREN